jgi:crotonobetainyl-CoA:carnitine CoA-transferase CaiB-like acyl-CoA transferase
MAALQDIKILDLSRVLAGPNCTQIFSDFGAEVWKIESLEGDESRTWGSSGYTMVNRGKKSLALNLADSRAQKIVRELAVLADVAVENFKVGNLAKFGLDFRNDLMPLNDRLVAVSVTGFGQTGPYKDGLGYDMVLQAMTGMMSVTGYPDRPPVRLGAPVNDIMLGLNAAISVLIALHARRTSGRGQFVDISLYDVGITSLLGVANDFLNDGVIPHRQGGAHPSVAPVQPYDAADGQILVAIGTEAQYARFCQAIDHPELITDPRFSYNADRFRNRDALNEILDRVLVTKTRAEWQEKFLAYKIPAGPLYDIPDALNDEHAVARNAVWTVESGEGPKKVLANAIQHMSRTPPSPAPAPRLGQHSRSILQGVLSISDEDFNTLVADGVVGVDSH